MCVNSYTHDIDTVSEYEQYDIDFDNGPNYKVHVFCKQNRCDRKSQATADDLLYFASTTVDDLLYFRSATADNLLFCLGSWR